MNIGGISTLYGGATVTATASKNVAATDVSATNNTSRKTTDIVLILEQNQKKREENIAEKLKEMERKQQELSLQFENADKQADAMAESIEAKMKCLLIAFRIMAGDDVPQADYKYLADNDMELYSQAITLRMRNDDPKKHKRVSEDEEESASGEVSEPSCAGVGEVSESSGGSEAGGSSESGDAPESGGE